MNKKRFAAVMLIVAAVIINLLILFRLQPNLNDATAILHLKIQSDQSLPLQIFYKENQDFTEDQVVNYSYETVEENSEVCAPVRLDTKFIRIDFGTMSSKTTISGLYFECSGNRVDVDIDRLLQPVITNNLEGIVKNDEGVEVSAYAGDPWLVFSVEDIDLQAIYSNAVQSRYNIYRGILCAIITLMAVFCIRNVEVIFRLPLDIYRDRDMFWELAKNDFQARFAGNYLGIIWAFIQPFITMLLYWFVFQVGLRAGKVSEYPFILFLMSGLIPWFYFSEALNGATNTLLEYSYLVKKVVFNVEILPAIKLVSSIFVHFFFVAFIMVICAVYGYMPDLYDIQLIYYILCMVLLLLGVSYVTAACTAFMRDTAQLVNIFLTMGIWITPIMWNPEAVLPEWLHRIFQINPIYYIVDGFRDALLNKVWFWEKPAWTIYFWCVTILIYIIGIKMFNRLKSHFADVL